MGDTHIQPSSVESTKLLPFYGDDKSSTIECVALDEDETIFTHVFSHTVVADQLPVAGD